LKKLLLLAVALLGFTFANAQSVTAQDIANASKSSIGSEHPIGTITAVFAKGNTLYYNYAVKSKYASALRTVFNTPSLKAQDKADRASALAKAAPLFKRNKINVTYQYYYGGVFIDSHKIAWYEMR